MNVIIDKSIEAFEKKYNDKIKKKDNYDEIEIKQKEMKENKKDKKEKDKKSKKVNSLMKPPVYDMSKPLYIFQREMERFLSFKSKDKKDAMLDLINILLKKEKRSLLEYKNIPLEELPDENDILELSKILDEKPEISNPLKIKRIDYSLPPNKIIHNLLSRIDYSFIEFTYTHKNKTYINYTIKPYKYDNNDSD